MIKYEIPNDWLNYNRSEVVPALVSARAGIIALTKVPYQRSWAEKLQEVQLKREVAGTSQIEGAVFAEGELEAALGDSLEKSFTRSQKQAFAAKTAYRFLATVPNDRPIDENLICEIHRYIVTNADDDHCAPGKLRQADSNVTFGEPKHRGAAGGTECEKSLSRLIRAVNSEYRSADILIQALALHYHLAAIHPFADGNGRTARALEALLLQRAGLKDLLFIAMSNYYYDQKSAYLSTLAETREGNHNLTSFLKFGLEGIALQCDQLLSEIGNQISKALLRDVMHNLYRRLKSKRKRVIVERQIEILNILLEANELEFGELLKRVLPFYRKVKREVDAYLRDISGLIELKAVLYRKEGGTFMMRLNIDWPTQITESSLYKSFIEMPEAKTHWFR